MKRSAPSLAIVALVLLAVAGMVVQTGSVPHVHVGAEAGIFNEEHDLTLLASLAGHATLVDASPTLTLEGAATALPTLVPQRPVTRVGHSADSRAPPAA